MCRETQPLPVFGDEPFLVETDPGESPWFGLGTGRPGPFDIVI